MIKCIVNLVRKTFIYTFNVPSLILVTFWSSFATFTPMCCFNFQNTPRSSKQTPIHLIFVMPILHCLQNLLLAYFFLHCFGSFTCIFLKVKLIKDIIQTKLTINELKFKVLQMFQLV
jgi:hypothetical protein